MTIARKQLGAQGEAMARTYLETRGFTFVAANVATRFDELDLVMRTGDTLVFVEVKTRRGVRAGLPQEAVTKHKLDHIIRAAHSYCRDHAHTGPWRIDVVAITGDTVTHLPNVSADVDF